MQIKSTEKTVNNTSSNNIRIDYYRHISQLQLSIILKFFILVLYPDSKFQNYLKTGNIVSYR